MVDLREYDVPFHVRYAIDNDIRAGHWYSVAAKVFTSPDPFHKALQHADVPHLVRAGSCLEAALILAP